VVSSKTRRRIHQLRRRRSEGWRYFLSSRFGVLVMTPLIAASLYFAAMKQKSYAETQEPIPVAALTSPAWVPSLARSVIPLSKQGGQITVNGRSLAIAWSEWQGRIGISDAGLMSGLGLDLLNSEDPTQQPVQWFSNPSRAESLKTWLTGQYRYLDVTDLAQKSGWRLDANGLVLRISTPTAKVKAVRQGQQSWGDRIIVELDRATPWQLTEQRGQAVITVDAALEPAVLRAFKGRRGRQVSSVKVERTGDRTTIRLGFPPELRVQVSSLANPNRLFLDVRPDYLEARDIQWAPGVRWKQQMVTLGGAKFPVVSLQLNLKEPGLSVQPIVSNPVNTVGIAPLSATAQRAQSVAAINGGFFNRNNQLPLGAIRRNDRWISSPILGRGAIAWNEAGEVTMGRLAFEENVTIASGDSIGKAFPLKSSNSGYVQSGMGYYTPDWGSSYTNITDTELLVTVRGDRVVSQRRTVPKTKTTVPIPGDGYLLVVRAYREAEAALAVGTQVQMNRTVLPNEFDRFTQVIGAGPLLLQNRQIVLNGATENFSPAFNQEAATRSIVGVTADGKMELVAIANRIGGRGATLGDAARIAQQMGFVSALNLDGGSSTTLYLGGQLLDRVPSTAARVHNGIGVFIKP
jgi:hypothetical protein